jgi:hypothetical protein
MNKEVTDILKNKTTPRKHGVWKHYKGGLYIVEGLATTEADQQVVVLYNSLSQPMPIPWSRPLSDWSTMVQHEGKQVARFVKCTIEGYVDSAEQEPENKRKRIK